MVDKKNGDGAGRPLVQADPPKGSVVKPVYHSPTNGSNGGASPCSRRYSELHEVEYPARLVLSRWNSRTGEPFAVADNKKLWSDVDVARRFGMYGSMEASGAIPYWWMVVEEDQAEAVAQALLLEDEYDYYDALCERRAVQLGVG